jgi:hypothetical protein
MSFKKQPTAKSIEDLVKEFEVLSSQADELRRKMAEITRQIEARKPLTSRSGYDIPKLPELPS